jgi:hypothetical protein
MLPPLRNVLRNLSPDFVNNQIQSAVHHPSLRNCATAQRQQRYAVHIERASATQLHTLTHSALRKSDSEVRQRERRLGVGM